MGHLPEQKIKRHSVAVGVWVAGVVSAVVAAVFAAIAIDWINRPPPDEVPLTIAVSVDADYCRTNWFVPRPPDQLDFSRGMRQDFNPDRPESYDWGNFYVADGGYPASPTEVYATIQGRDEADVVLTSMSITVRQRRPSPQGTLLDDPCGDVGSFRWLEVDLDQDSPRPSPTFDQDMLEVVGPDTVSPQERQPIRFPYKVSLTEAETFLIQSHTVTCDCEWVATVSWQSQGRSGNITIDDHGRAFHTIGSGGITAICQISGIDTCHAP